MDQESINNMPEEESAPILSEELLEKLKNCEKQLDYSFENILILRHALRHASCAPSFCESNERLEFLGDGFLSFAVADILYNKHPESGEGHLTQFRSSLVSNKALSGVARELELDKYILLEESMNSANLSNRILGSTVEAVVAAIYLDGGYEAAYKFVAENIANKIVGTSEQEAEPENYKSVLQQLAQSFGRQLPKYRVISAVGPDHKKLYTVAVEYAGMTFECGCGFSKKEAEQKAAEKALKELKGLDAENR